VLRRPFGCTRTAAVSLAHGEQRLLCTLMRCDAMLTVVSFPCVACTGPGRPQGRCCCSGCQAGQLELLPRADRQTLTQMQMHTTPGMHAHCSLCPPLCVSMLSPRAR